MSKENIQFDIGASLFAMCKQFMVDQGLDTEDWEVFDFDAHTVQQGFPDKHLVGIAEYSLTEQQGMYEGHCMVIICTKQDDSQLKILKPLVSKMFNRLKVTSSIPIYEEATGNTLGNLKTMDGTEASAIARTSGRPLQAVNIRFGAAI